MPAFRELTSSRRRRTEAIHSRNGTSVLGQRIVMQHSRPPCFDQGWRKDEERQNEQADNRRKKAAIESDDLRRERAILHDGMGGVSGDDGRDRQHNEEKGTDRIADKAEPTGAIRVRRNEPKVELRGGPQKARPHIQPPYPAQQKRRRRGRLTAACHHPAGENSRPVLLAILCQLGIWPVE